MIENNAADERACFFVRAIVEFGDIGRRISGGIRRNKDSS